MAARGDPGTLILRETGREDAVRTAALALIGVASTGLTLAQPAVLGRALDQALGSDAAGGWVTLCAGLVAAQVVLAAAADLLGAVTTARATARLRGRAVRRLLDAGPGSEVAGRPGDLLTRLVGNAADAAAAPAAAAAVPGALIGPVGAVVALALTDPWLALAFVAGAPALTLLVRRFARASSDSVLRYQEAQGAIAARFVEALGGARTIAAAGTEERENARVLGPLPELARQGHRMWRVQGRAAAHAALLVPLLQIVVLAVAGLRLAQGALSPGDLLAASRYALLATGIGSIVGQLSGLIRARTAAGRLSPILALAAPRYREGRLPGAAGAGAAGGELGGGGEGLAGTAAAIGHPGGELGRGPGDVNGAGGELTGGGGGLAGTGAGAGQADGVLNGEPEDLSGAGGEPTREGGGLAGTSVGPGRADGEPGRAPGDLRGAGGELDGEDNALGRTGSGGGPVAGEPGCGPGGLHRAGAESGVESGALGGTGAARGRVRGEPGCARGPLNGTRGEPDSGGAGLGRTGPGPGQAAAELLGGQRDLRRAGAELGCADGELGRGDGEPGRPGAESGRADGKLGLTAPPGGSVAARRGRRPGTLELRGVSAARGGDIVLDRLDLTVPGGSCVAVVGRSGAGKSVLAAVAGRLAEPDSGSVLLDGQPLAALDRAELRRAVAFAFERPVLFGDTIADAIAFGPRPAEPESVEAAARAAGADPFIRLLPAGYGTPRATAPLSGGETQRLGLARAFAHAERLLILDDATSSLDTLTERHVVRSLAGDPRGRTRLLITHRAATAARADLVAWLDAGRVRALAPHAVLWADPGYRALFAPPGEPAAVSRG